jgi:glutaryl-CoA dehydrogenase
MSATAVDLLDVEGLLGDDDKAVRDTVRRFVDKEAMPIVAEAARRGAFPWTLAAGVSRLGLLGAPLTTHGCAGLSPLAYGLCLAELERADSGLRAFASVQTSLVMVPIARFGSAAQKDRWLPRLREAEAVGCFGLTEPDAGSDPAAMRTRAKKTATGWRLNGCKRWITNGTRADVAVIWARTQREDGADDTIRGFLVEKGTPGYEQHPIDNKQSFRMSDTAELRFDDVDLGEDAVLPEARGLAAPLYVLNEARFGIAFGVLGSAAACLEVALDFVRDRQVFGRPIAATQLAQEKLAEMAVELAKARLVVWRLAQLKAAGAAEAVQVSVAKRNNVAIALDIARTARALLGANGITDDYPVMRHMVNLETIYTYEGTHDVHTLVIGNFLTGQKAF